MSKKIVLFLVWIVSLTTHAQTTYYVSNSGGDDANDGTEVAPFKTIQKAVDIMTAGDEAIVKGGVYRETIVSKTSGTDGNPITIKAADGENVILTATDIIDANSWAVHSGNIYKAPFSSKAYALYAFNSGLQNFDFSQNTGDKAPELMTEARFPNKPNTNFTIFETIENSNYTPVTRNENTITIPSLPANIDYTGAKVYAYSQDKGTRWWSFAANVTENSGNALQTTDPRWRSNSAAGYVSGVLEFLDTEKEWFSSGTELYFNALNNAHPNTLTVEAKTRHYVIDINHDYIVIDGFKTFGGAAYIGGSYNEIKNAYFRHPNHHLFHFFGHTRKFKPNGHARSAILLAGDHNKVSSIHSRYAAGDVVVMAGSFNIVENSTMLYSSYLGHYAHTVTIAGHDNTVIGNTMTHTGKSHVRLHHGYEGQSNRGSKRFRILYNDLSQNAYVAHDVGIVVGWGIYSEGSEIAYNWIHDNLTSTNNSKINHGIYLDNNNRNFFIHHNTIWNIKGNNIRLNSPTYDTYVYNNTLANSGEKLGQGTFYQASNKDLDGSQLPDGYFDVYVANNYMFAPVSLKKKYKFAGSAANIVEANNSLFQPNAFQIDANSSAVDKGVSLENVTINVTDGKPDVGAYEAGTVAWIPGVNRLEAGITPILQIPVPNFTDLKDDAALNLDGVGGPTTPVDTNPTSDFTQWESKSAIWSINGGEAENIAQPNSLEQDNERLFHAIENFKVGVEYKLLLNYTIYNTNGGSNAGFKVSVHEGELADDVYQGLTSKVLTTNSVDTNNSGVFEMKFTPTSPNFVIVVHKNGSAGDQAYLKVSNLNILPPVTTEFTQWKSNSGKWNVKTAGKASNSYSSGSVGPLAYHSVVVEPQKEYKITFDYIITNKPGNTGGGIKVGVHEGEFSESSFSNLALKTYDTNVQEPQTANGSGEITFIPTKFQVSLNVAKKGKGKQASAIISNVQIQEITLSANSFENKKTGVIINIENNQFVVNKGSLETIYNALGQEVANSNLKDGIYFVKVSNGQQSDIVKVIK